MTSFNFHLWLPWIRQLLPQVNEEKTRVQLVHCNVVRIPLVQPLKAMDPHTERKGGWRARWRRILGEMFKSERWYAMGTRFVPTTYTRYREIEIKMAAFGYEYETPTFPGKGSVVRIAMGYDAVTDTLYVDPDRTSKYPPVWAEWRARGR